MSANLSIIKTESESETRSEMVPVADQELNFSNLFQQSENLITQIKKVNISLDPSQINKDYKITVEKKLKTNYEGKFYDNAYLIPGSINILKTEDGFKKGSHFTGRLIFPVQFEANYFVPNRGSELVCQVLTVNKFGVLATSLMVPSEVVIPRQLQNELGSITDDDRKLSFLNSLNPNDLITVKIIDFSIKFETLVIVAVAIDRITDFKTKQELKLRGLPLTGEYISHNYRVKINKSAIDTKVANVLSSFQELVRRTVKFVDNLNDLINLYNIEKNPKVFNQIKGLIEKDYQLQLEQTSLNIQAKLNQSGYKTLYQSFQQSIKALSRSLQVLKFQLQPQINAIVPTVIKKARDVSVDSDDASGDSDDEVDSDASGDSEDASVDTDASVDNDVDTDASATAAAASASEVRVDQPTLPRELAITFNSDSFKGIEEELSKLGVDFFDNRFKNELEQLQNRLGNLIEQEKIYTLQYGPNSKSIIWEKPPRVSNGPALLSLKSLVNPYELVEDRFSYQPEFQYKTKSGQTKTLKSRAFFKFLEIDRVYSLTDQWRDRTVQSFHLAEGPGGFIHALARNRKLTTIDAALVEGDKYVGITRSFRFLTGFIKDPDGVFKIDKYNTNNRKRQFYNPLSTDRGKDKGKALYIYDAHGPLADYFESIEGDKQDWNNRYSKKIKEVYPQADLIYGDNNEFDTGDINSTGLLFNLVEQHGYKHQFDLVTADGGFGDDTDLKEVRHAYLFFNEILWALTLLKSGGHFVIKIYDIYRQITSDLLGILTLHFGEVHIFKPKSSRQGNNEKYIICKHCRPPSNEQLAVFRRLSDRWSEEIHHYNKYSLDQNRLILKYDTTFDEKYLREVDRLINNYQGLQYLKIEKVVTDKKEKLITYDLTLSASLTRAIRHHPYRIELIFNLITKKQEEVLVNSILEASFNLQMRDLIATFVNQLYLSQISSLSQGLSKFEKILGWLKDPNSYTEGKLPYLPEDSRIDRVGKLLELFNDSETMKELTDRADSWKMLFTKGGTTPLLNPR